MIHPRLYAWTRHITIRYRAQHRSTRSYSTPQQQSPPLVVQPRFNYAQLAEQMDVYVSSGQSRRYDPINPDAYRQLCTDRRALYQQLIDLRSQQNKLSKSLALAQKQRNKQQPSPSITDQRQHAQVLKQSIRSCEQQLDQVESQLLQQSLSLPNTIHPDAPANEPVLVKQVNGPPMSSSCLDHVALNDHLHFMDLEQASRVSGASFYYLQGMGALLELALVQYAMQKAVAHGFYPLMTPDLVRTSVVHACGFQPRRGESEQIYKIQQDDPKDKDGLSLVGTAEIALAGKCAQQVLPEASLPRRFVGFGHAFRREAGGRGQETRGLYRVHQFSKLELFVVSTPDQSDTLLHDLVALQEDIFSSLGLTYRVLDMPHHELGASAHRKFDIEAWLPGRQAWGEISSTSNCTDYQSRRLDIRYRPTHPEQHKENTLFCHTLNGTAMAVPRVLIALVESFQQPDGSVLIPAVLQPWLPGQPTVWTPSPPA
ncbi:seryl-tRNA synthetase [Hesseltinella vesiculosa]|uniref:serine--tRNA ligase n=1 Tax=Hesseltinella vesiculosa TaxID=101127 RepID=A0A1X2GY01_9FUNG|nr:seryl-tRNA synthetase [Hesseltinella vesiculosa]